MTKLYEGLQDVCFRTELQPRREQVEPSEARLGASRPGRWLRRVLATASLAALLAALLSATMSAQQDALKIDGSGNVGIGTEPNPGIPLSFATGPTGEKISVWKIQGKPSWGIGFTGGAMQIHTGVPGTSIAFGFGNSDKTDFVTTMRISGDGTPNDPKAQLQLFGDANVSGRLTATNAIVGGNVGIGTGDRAPVAKLDVNGNANVTGQMTATSATVNGLLTATNANVSGTMSANTAIVTGNAAVGSLTVGGVAVNGYPMPNNQVGASTLDVHGNLRVRTHVYVDGYFVLKDHYGAYTKDKWVQIGTWGGNYVRWDGTNAPYDAPSDLRLKSGLQSIPSALDKIHHLRGVTYRWNSDGLRYLTRDIETSLSAGPQATAEENQKLWRAEREKRYKELANTQVGVVAQDVEGVLPEAVTTDETGYKSVRYNELIPLLIEAVKELEDKVKDQSQVVAQQQQEIARLTARHLAAEQQQAELAAVKAQLARLEAAVQRVTAAQLAGAPDAVVRLSGPVTH